MKPLRLAAAALCLPLLACYEEPVRDHLHLSFLPGPAIIVTAVREISSPGSAADNPAVEDRLDEASSDLARGWDRWSRSFSDLGALADRSTVERREGRARRGVHSALLGGFRQLERLLGNEGLGAWFEDVGGIRELELHPSGGSQATRAQREDLDRGLESWSKHVADYLEAATALYAHLDEAPRRAIPCLAHVFDDHPEGSGPLEPREEELVNAVKEHMEEVATALLIDDDRAHSLNELSRLVFDSFQGRLTVAVDGPVIELEGFDDHTTFVERPPVDVWRVLSGLIGQWLSPDLVTAMVTPGPDAAQPEVDTAAFAAAPRRWGPPPDAWTVESELRARLQPENVYRVRWRTRPASGDEDEALNAGLTALADAERDLPD